MRLLSVVQAYHYYTMMQLLEIEESILQITHKQLGREIKKKYLK